MNPTPPPLPRPGPSKPANFRSAWATNLFLPGAGLFVVGRTGLGLVFMGSFLICFLGVMGLFLAGYMRYMKGALDPNLLQGDQLERLGAGFHPPWLIGFGLAGAVIYAASIVVLSCVKKSPAAPGPQITP